MWSDVTVIMWAHEMNQKIISPFSHDLWSVNLAGCWLWAGCLERKCLGHHQLLVLFVEYKNPKMTKVLKKFDTN